VRHEVWTVETQLHTVCVWPLAVGPGHFDPRDTAPLPFEWGLVCVLLGPSGLFGEEKIIGRGQNAKLLDPPEPSLCHCVA